MTEPTTPLTCRDTTWLVSNSRDQALTHDEADQLADHLRGCPACRIAATQFTQLFAQLDTLFGRDAGA